MPQGSLNAPKFPERQAKGPAIPVTRRPKSTAQRSAARRNRQAAMALTQEEAQARLKELERQRQTAGPDTQACLIGEIHALRQRLRRYQGCDS